MPERERCFDCGAEMLIEKRAGAPVTYICDDCARRYGERYGVRKKIVKRKPRKT